MNNNDLSTIDLHTHTNLSDGTDTPDEIIREFESRGLKVCAITDHDHILKSDLYESLKKSTGIKLINGIEASTVNWFNEQKYSIHVLGYGVKDLLSIDEFVKTQQLYRKQRNQKILEKIRKNIPAGGKIPEYVGSWDMEKTSRIHFAKLLMDLNMADSIKICFQKYLTRGRPFYIEKQSFSFEQTIKIMKESFFLVCMAHPFISFPKSLTHEKKVLTKTMENFCSVGLDGFEVFYPEHKMHEEKFLHQFCLDNKLVYTAGSDYHGKNKPYVKIGQISQRLSREEQLKIENFMCQI